MPRLTLDRELLTVFVFGPGEGEALAVWLPNEGWLFVDACRRSYVATERGDLAFEVLR